MTGLTKRTKKRCAAQQMVLALGALAHNVLVWARAWLAPHVPALAHFGLPRLVRVASGRRRGRARVPPGSAASGGGPRRDGQQASHREKVARTRNTLTLATGSGTIGAL